MLDEIDDTRLAAQAAEGDRAAFARLVERHYDRIHALAWKFLGNAQDAEDLAQEVCMTLGRRISGFRGEARFSTWLYQVVLNAARDAMRRNASRARATAGFAEVDAMRRAEAEEAGFKARWLREAIASLKEDLRETAVLVLDEGLPHAHAAEILGVAESTVSWRLMEVRRALKERAAAGEGPT